MNYAIILSGGIGSRMKIAGMPKQYLKVKNKPILIYTVEKFEYCRAIDHIVIVAASMWKTEIETWLSSYGIKKAVSFAKPGGTRQESILNGINECMKHPAADKDVVIIHDAVRPMVQERMIEECIQNAFRYGGCMPALPINDTVYQSSDGSSISNLLDRTTLFAGQAPEAFNLLEYARINNAVSLKELDSYRGTSEIAYQYGIPVYLMPGDDMNYKITTPGDLERFRLYCETK